MPTIYLILHLISTFKKRMIDLNMKKGYRDRMSAHLYRFDHTLKEDSVTLLLLLLL